MKQGKYDILMPAPEKAPRHTRNILAWMWYFCTPYKRLIVFFWCFRTVRYMWLALLPTVVGILINVLESGEAQASPGIYIAGLVGFMLVYAVMLINVFFVPEINAYEKAARALTLYSINHINGLPLNWHEAQGSGGKLQRIMTGRRGFQELFRHFRWDFFPLLGSLLAIGVSAMVMDIPLSYIPYYILFVATYLFASWYFARNYFNLYDRFNRRFEGLLSGVYEFVSAIRTVKAFDLNHIILRKAQLLEKEGQEAIIDAYSTNLFRWTMCNLIAGAWLFLFAWLGFHAVLRGEMSPGTFAAVFFLASNIWTSIETIASIWEKVYEYGNGIYRLADMLCLSPKELDIKPLEDMPENWRKITFENVSFSYSEETAKTVKGQGLYDVGFTIKRGEKVAVVGPSGAGKSTLIKVLMKQVLPSRGRVMVGETDLCHIPSAQWLGSIGFVPQDVELFNTTLRENILFENDDMAEEQYRTILKQAAIDDFIRSLPAGDQTLVGERGIKLSGGQRQRIGIARALARQAELIIFDEATSSLDTLSESQIQEAIESSFTGHTLVIIAHRLSTIRHVDRIVVLDHGYVAEQGSFEELIAKKDGLFAQSWKMQTGEKSRKK